MKRRRVRWNDTPIAFVTLPPPPPPEPCPHCDSRTQPIYVRSDPQGDGSNLRKLICSKCSEPFRIVVEFATDGNSADGDL